MDEMDKVLEGMWNLLHIWADSDDESEEEIQINLCDKCRKNLELCQYYMQYSLQWIPWLSAQEVKIEVIDNKKPSSTPISEAEMNEVIARMEYTLQNVVTVQRPN